MRSLTEALHIRTTNIDWARTAKIFGALSVFWIGIVKLVPPNIYEPVSIVLIAIQSALLYLTRSGKYVENRYQDPPPEEQR